MANEIKLGYYTGQTLTYAVYNPDGTEVTAPGTSLPEVGTTGYYTASNASIAAGDVCIVSDTNGVLFQGEYLPDTTSSVIEGKIDTVDTNIDTLVTAQQTVNNNFPATEPVNRKPRIINL
jgi:hypothetical protein